MKLILGWCFNNITKRFTQIHISNLKTNSDLDFIEYDSSMPISIPIDARSKKPIKLFNHFLNEFKGRVLIAAETKGRLETITELFKNKKKPIIIDDWNSFLDGEIQFGITVMPIENGLIINKSNIAIISEMQLFGERAMQRRLRKRQKLDPDAIVRNLTELRIGSPVVHEEHGVGRYCGLINIEVGEVLGEFIHLEYADRDKLYVPVSALDLISRYTGVDPENAPLHRLGSNHWQKAKCKAAEKQLFLI